MSGDSAEEIAAILATPMWRLRLRTHAIGARAIGRRWRLLALAAAAAVVLYTLAGGWR